MKRNLIFLALALCSCIVCAQPKENGRTPRREKRGFNECIVIDQANIRVLYALNAKDIKNENTYVDLGKLEIGKNVKKYSSEFLAISDKKLKEWMKKNKYNGPAPKDMFMGGRKEFDDNWSELVFSEYIIRGKQMTEYACFPLYAERENGQYTEEWPLMKWTLVDEHQTILGHKCQKATCRFRGRDFEAWFATSVPVKGGPWKFGGLPGCILKVYDKDKIYVWEAVAIERGAFNITQYPDKLYPKSTRESIWKRQKLYNEDYWEAIGWTSLEGRQTPKKKVFKPVEKE